MADLSLTLGGVTFTGFEIPEFIDVALRQSHNNHKLIGGERVVDAMGADYEPILWAGRFRGADAEARARRLEAMAAGGGEQDLAWSGYYYRVLVTGFRAKFERRYEIPYQIECTVVSAPGTGGGGGGFAQTIDAIVGPDLAALGGLALPPVVTDALGAVNASVTALAPLAARSNVGLSPVRLAMTDATAAVNAAILDGDAAIDAAQVARPDIPVGLAAIAIAQGAVTALRDQADLADAAGLVGRVASNLTIDQTARG